MAYGSVPPTGDRSHCKSKVADHASVSINTVIHPYEDIPLPVSIEEAEMFTLKQAKGSFVLWPCAWVRLIDGVSIKFVLQNVKRNNIFKL